MYPCRKKDTFEDGKLYYLGQDSMLPSVYRTDDNFGWNCVTSNLYSMKVRQDWLDALNMDEILGTVAGDNCIFACLKEGVKGEDFMKSLKKRIPDLEEE